MNRTLPAGLRAAASLATALALHPVALAAADAPDAPRQVYASYDGQIPDIVAELVVQAATPGPAWWKVTKGDSVVWILGTPPNISARLAWDQHPLQRRLAGARLFLTPLYLTPQPYSVDDDGKPRPDRDYWRKPGETVGDLPPATQARLKAAYQKLTDRTVSPQWSLIYATRQLNKALFNRVPLSTTALPGALDTAGRAAMVAMVQTRADTGAASNAYAEGPVGPKIACLESTLAVAESGPDPLRKSQEAWAAGNLDAVMATTGCVGAKAAVYRQEVVGVTSTLRFYLAVPGKTVAAVELIPLLMQDGVIARLIAAGYTVEGPDSRSVAADYAREVAAP